MLEGLVRTARDSPAIRGVSGRDKAATVMREHGPLSAPRCLKAPAIFGLHGIYRLLAAALKVPAAGRQQRRRRAVRRP